MNKSLSSKATASGFESATPRYTRRDLHVFATLTVTDTRRPASKHNP